MLEQQEKLEMADDGNSKTIKWAKFLSSDDHLPGSQEYDQLYGRHLRSNCVIGPDLSIQLKYQGKQQKQLQSNRSERKIKMM